MKTPIKYWGGKQQLADKIISLIPPHHCYTEAFFGGGAVFFQKPVSKVEIINDLNDNMVNFYKVVKRGFPALASEIDVTLYSEHQFRQAKEIWLNSTSNEEVMRAWAVFVLSHQSFSGIMGNSWAHSDTQNLAKKYDNMKKLFDERYCKRMQSVQFFCRDAIDVIALCDSPTTFHFVDPPYFNSDMGHYDGYTADDFRKLLDLLGKLQGKFLLTTYPSDILAEYSEKFGWQTIKHEMHKSASTIAGTMKTEVFTMNYAPPQQGKLF